MKLVRTSQLPLHNVNRGPRWVKLINEFMSSEYEMAEVLDIDLDDLPFSQSRLTNGIIRAGLTQQVKSVVRGQRIFLLRTEEVIDDAPRRRKWSPYYSVISEFLSSGQPSVAFQYDSDKDCHNARMGLSNAIKRSGVHQLVRVAKEGQAVHLLLKTPEGDEERSEIKTRILRKRCIHEWPDQEEFFNAINQDDCPFCGSGPYQRLSNHMYLSHGITARQARFHYEPEMVN